MEPPDPNGELEHVRGGSSETPEGICGFELRPEDLGIHMDIRKWRRVVGTTCCWRKVWKNDRCVWHDEEDKKHQDIFEEACYNKLDQNHALSSTRFSPREQLDGAYLVGAYLSDSNLHDCSLRVANLTNANLEEADLSNANLWAANLSGANLEEADLSDANLWYADLSDTDLEGSDLSDTGLRCSSLSGSNLREADLSDANLREADLSDANLGNADLFKTYLRFADLSHANLSDTDLSDARLGGADLSNADIRDADLSDARLGEADLSNADIRDADLSDASLGEADLSNADMVAANLSDANLSGADLSDSNLWGTDLSGSYVDGADLPNANLGMSDLFNANLKGADLSNANLRDTTLLRASFDDTSLKNVDLSDAQIHCCSFEGADLTGAECDGTTFGGNHLYGARLQDVHLSDRTTFEAPPGDWFDADPIDAENHLDPNPSFVERIRRGVRRTIALYRMNDPDTDDDGVTSFEKARNAYRERERLYRENSLTDRVGDAYEGAKRSRHREALAKGNWFSYVGLAARRWTMGYGERPWRLVGMSALLIVGSAVVYPMLGGVQIGDGSGTIVGGSMLSRIPPLVPDAVGSVPFVEPLAHHGSVFLTSLYFSVITFTTLGYGGIQPHGSLVKAFASLESLVGTIILAMFVAVYARKKMR